MRIKRLDIVGFKSFPNKTTLLFDKPIVGVVGPNGCGKSNIVDAIRWVMGEQGMKALRGRNREDVIFAGSESRAPSGVAEVTLTFDNSDRLAPPQYVDYAEIAITRKLYRNGDSDYLINNTECRLKDITDIFLGTGVGNKAYSIIEQGRISLIVSAKPEDRRFMIEEAAGITKYNTRKREAERKMAATRQNLLRVNDIITELKKQLGSLSRQAKKAERYREYKAQYKQLDLRFSAHDYAEIVRQGQVIIDRIAELEQGITDNANKLLALEGEVNARNLQLAEWEQKVTTEQEEAIRLDQQISLSERDLQSYSEEIERISARKLEFEREAEDLIQQLDTQKRLVEQLEGEQRRAVEQAQLFEGELADVQERSRAVLDDLGQKQNDAERLKRTINESILNADRARHRLETIRQRANENVERTERNRREKLELETQHDEQEAQREVFLNDLGGLRQMKLRLDTERTETTDRLSAEHEAYLDVEERLTNERDSFTAVRSRLDSLQELDRSLEGFGEGVKAVIGASEGRFDDGELVDVLARLVEVDVEHEKALSAALGERLQWLVVRDRQAGHKGLSLLEELQAGRAGFIPSQGMLPQHDDAPENCRSLLEVVRVKPEGGDSMERLLSGVMLVPDMATAESEWERCNGRYSFVTPEGVLLDSSGAIYGGGGESISQALLKRQREMQQLSSQKTELAASCEQLALLRDEHLQRIRSLERQVESTRQEGHRQEIKILEQEKDLRHLEDGIDQLRRRLESLEREFHAYQSEMGELQEQRREQEAKLEQETDTQQRSERQLQSAQIELAELSERRELISRELTDKQVQLAEASQKRRHLESELKMSRQREVDLAGRREKITFDREQGDSRNEQLTRLIEVSREKRETTIQQREQMEANLRKQREELSHEQEALRDMAEQVRAARHKQEELNGQLSESKLTRNELSFKSKHLEERIQERYGLDLGKDYFEYITEEEPGEKERDEMERIKGHIERIGDVNLGAISEYDQVSERYQFLLDQEEDLKRSLDMLENAIKKINRTTRKRFKETFEEVNRRFSELYPQLFGGGEARLEILDPQDMLHTGLEIVARPPGKKLQAVSLLSGGEKALTAVSLIFAIFLYRPTPFCLLDEVDAPLDDINISRFNSTVKRISKLSQFILITHNKKTMEITNTLYGVTMEEPGISKIVSVNLT